MTAEPKRALPRLEGIWEARTPAGQRKIAAKPKHEAVKRRISGPALLSEKTMKESYGTLIPHIEKAKSHSIEEFASSGAPPSTSRKPTALEELGGCGAPDWVQDKAKYRDMCKVFKSEARKAKVDPSAFDFDQELYDDRASKDHIRATIEEKVWGTAQGPEAEEHLAQLYHEERMEIPVKEYHRLVGKAEYGEAVGTMAREIAVEKKRNCLQRALNICKKVGKSGYGTLRKQVAKLRKECPADYKGILRKGGKKK